MKYLKHKAFLRWFLLFNLILLGAVFLLITGIFQEVNKADFTKISFLIYGIFLYFSVKCGINTFKANADIETGWFVADILFTMGLIGTVIGLKYVFEQALPSLNISQAQNTQMAISDLAKGIGTALYTTAAGLICGLLLKIQLFNLKQNAK